MRDRAERPSSAYDVLKNEILNGDLGPGDKLVETNLAERLQVSRTPIREALTRLEHDGLTERGPRGYFVRQRSPEEIIDTARAAACSKRWLRESQPNDVPTTTSVSSRGSPV